MNSTAQNIVLDYYPFGSVQPGRSFNAGNYRYSFNGKENEGKDWTSTDGSHLDFGARIYDSRIAKFLSVDPLYKEYPYWSSYLYAGDNPILYIDENGEGVLVLYGGAVASIGGFFRGFSRVVTYATIYDDIGVTQVTSHSRLDFNEPNEEGSTLNKRPNMIAGFDIGLEAGFYYDYKSKTFEN